MATKSEMEVRLSSLEESLMQTSRGFRTELNSVVELLAKVRSDLDRARAELQTTKNTVDTIKSLQANYDVSTKAF